jgi:hypothetical protein
MPLSPQEAKPNFTFYADEFLLYLWFSHLLNTPYKFISRSLFHLSILLIQILFIKEMISVESHSKQIKLLNDYILALEKQVASARKEN